MVIVQDHVVNRAWELFADLLDYPFADPRELLRECKALTAPEYPDAAIALGDLLQVSGEWSLGDFQEEYTRAFDLDETHSLYVGYHLLGESYKRSAMLLEFKERYREYGIEVAGELSDHLPVVLRFLAACDDSPMALEILGEAVWPMLDMMTRKDAKAEEANEDELDRPPTVSPPYHRLLSALLAVVETVSKRQGQPLVITRAVGNVLVSEGA